MNSLVEPSGSIQDLIGLTRAKNIALKILQPDSPVQSVLFYGIDGCGNSDIARLLSQAWACLKPTSDGPCSECTACKLGAKNSLPDVLKIAPTGPSGNIRVAALEGDPETGTIGVQQFITTRPMVARNKVIWIEQANRMNAATANAFLKTLEEPPGFVKIVMTAPSPSSVLTTIASRCLCVACDLPSRGEHGFEPTQVEYLLGGRSPVTLEHIHQYAEAYQSVMDIANRMVSASPRDALALSSQLRRAADSMTSTDRPLRKCLSELIESLATASASLLPCAVPAIVEAHRRIVGNGSPVLVLDAMFAKILTS